MSYIASFIAAAWRVFERVTPIAFLLAIVGLLFQAVAAELQAVSTSWQLLTSDTKGSAGKVYALEYLNNDNKVIWGFKLPFEVPPLIKKRANLDGIDLSIVDFDGKCPEDLNRRVMLQGVNLQHAEMNGANMQCVNFKGPFIGKRGALNDATRDEYANFHCAKLTGSDFSGSILDSANFAEATLQRVTFSGASMREGVNFRDAYGPNSTFEDVEFGGQPARFDDAQLEGATFQIVEPRDDEGDREYGGRVAVSFRGADLTDAVIRGYQIAANFSRGKRDVRLIRADLSYASWSGSEFTGAILTDAKFMGADLSKTTGITSLRSDQVDKFTVLPTREFTVVEAKPKGDGIKYGRLGAAQADVQTPIPLNPTVSGDLVNIDTQLEIQRAPDSRVLIVDGKIERAHVEFEDRLDIHCRVNDKSAANDKDVLACREKIAEQANTKLRELFNKLSKKKPFVRCVTPTGVGENRAIQDQLEAKAASKVARETNAPDVVAHGEPLARPDVHENAVMHGWCMRVVNGRNVLLADDVEQLLASLVPLTDEKAVSQSNQGATAQKSESNNQGTEPNRDGYGQGYIEGVLKEPELLCPRKPVGNAGGPQAQEKL